MNNPTVSCDYLFQSDTKYTRRFKKYIRCEICIYAEKRSDLPSNYIHCTKYPRMISEIDYTCKSSTTGAKNE